MKRAGAVIGAAVLTAAFSLGTSGVAHADPYDCSGYFLNKSAWRHSCANGTGYYRAIVYCDNTWPGRDYERPGNWVRVGHGSVAFCDGNDKAKGGGMQVGG
jgi:hypothetical protein